MTLNELIASEIEESKANGGSISRVDSVKIDAAESTRSAFAAAISELASEVRDLQLEDEFVGGSEASPWRVRLLKY